MRGDLIGGFTPSGQACFQAVEGLGGKELNKPKGLGHFSCDTPHRLSRGLGGGWGGCGGPLDGGLPPPCCRRDQQCLQSIVFKDTTRNTGVSTVLKRGYVVG